MKQAISSLKVSSSDPWIAAGDFNALLFVDEKKGGSHTRTSISKDFMNWTLRDNTMDLGIKGLKFTWQTGNLFERLDRVFNNDKWRFIFPEYTVFNLPNLSSDDRPIFLRLNSYKPPSMDSRPFRFQAAWLTNDSFKRVVSDAWSSTDSFSTNLLNLQNKLKVWNKEVFGNIFKEKRSILARIEGIECAMEKNLSMYLLIVKI